MKRISLLPLLFLLILLACAWSWDQYEGRTTWDVKVTVDETGCNGSVHSENLTATVAHKKSTATISDLGHGQSTGSFTSNILSIPGRTIPDGDGKSALGSASVAFSPDCLSFYTKYSWHYQDQYQKCSGTTAWQGKRTDAQECPDAFVVTEPAQETASQPKDTSISSNYAVDQGEFTDVLIGDPQYEAITSLSDQGVIGGYPDGSFKPENVVTRAELLKFAFNGSVTQLDQCANAQNPFGDVTNSHTLKQYVICAYSKKIVNGYDDGNFRPDQTVNKVEGLKILLNAFGVNLPTTDTQLFDDVPVTAWYAPYIAYAVDNNLVFGGENSGLYEVTAVMHRREVADLTYKLSNLLGKNSTRNL